MKLGFAIKVVSAGAGEPKVFNRGKWINKVTDVRDYLKMFGGLIGTKNKLTFLCFDEEGCFLTVLRSISGRDGDHISGWIYIPKCIEISGDQVVSVYRFVCDILDESNLSEREKEIKEIFDTSYKEKEKIFPQHPQNGEKWGIRYTGKQQMNEILGDNRYQHYYSEYKTIFLLEQAGEVQPVIGGFTDLTSQRMHTYKFIAPNDAKDWANLGKNCTLYFENGEPFNKGKWRSEDDTLHLIAKRPGFIDISLDPIRVVEWEREVLSKIKLDWKIELTKSTFKVYSAENNKPLNFCVLIDGYQLGNKVLSESQAKEITFTIRAQGYKEETMTVTLSEGVKDILVLLHRKAESESYKIYLNDSSLADMELTSTGKKPFRFKGYKKGKYDDILTLDKWFVIKQRLIGFGIAIIVVIACSALYVVVQKLNNCRLEILENKNINNTSSDTGRRTNDKDLDLRSAGNKDSINSKKNIPGIAPHNNGTPNKANSTNSSKTRSSTGNSNRNEGRESKSSDQSQDTQKNKPNRGGTQK